MGERSLRAVARVERALWTAGAPSGAVGRSHVRVPLCQVAEKQEKLRGGNRHVVAARDFWHVSAHISVQPRMSRTRGLARTEPSPGAVAARDRTPVICGGRDLATAGVKFTHNSLFTKPIKCRPERGSPPTCHGTATWRQWPGINRCRWHRHASRDIRGAEPDMHGAVNRGHLTGAGRRGQAGGRSGRSMAVSRRVSRSGPLYLTAAAGRATR
jgi:hypothetical protein